MRPSSRPSASRRSEAPLGRTARALVERQLGNRHHWSLASRHFLKRIRPQGRPGYVGQTYLRLNLVHGGGENSWGETSSIASPYDSGRCRVSAKTIVHLLRQTGVAGRSFEVVPERVENLSSILSRTDRQPAKATVHLTARPVHIAGRQSRVRMRVLVTGMAGLKETPPDMKADASRLVRGRSQRQPRAGATCVRVASMMVVDGRRGQNEFLSRITSIPTILSHVQSPIYRADRRAPLNDNLAD